MSYSQANPANMFEDMQRMPTQYLQQVVAQKDANSSIAMAVLGERNKVAAAAQAQQAQQAAQASTSVADQIIGRAQQLATQQQRSQQGIASIQQQAALPGGGGIGQMPPRQMARGGIVAFAEGDVAEGPEVTEQMVQAAYEAWQAAKPSWFSQQTPTSAARAAAAEAEFDRLRQAFVSRKTQGPGAPRKAPAQAPAAPQDNTPVGRFNPGSNPADVQSMLLGIEDIKDPVGRANAFNALMKQMSQTGSASMAPAGFGPPERPAPPEAPRGRPSAPAPTLPAAPAPQVAEAPAQPSAPAAPAQPSASEKILQELLSRQAPAAPTPQEALRQAQEMNALGGVPEAMKAQQDLMAKFQAAEQERLGQRSGRREGLMALLNGMQGRSPLKSASMAYSNWEATNNADAKNVAALEFQMKQKIAEAELLYKRGNVEEAKAILKGVIADQKALGKQQADVAATMYGEEQKGVREGMGNAAAMARTRLTTGSSEGIHAADRDARERAAVAKTADDTKAQKLMLDAAVAQGKILLAQRKAAELTGGDVAEIDRKLAVVDATIRQAGGVPEADPNASGTVLRYDNKGNRIN